MTGGLETLNKSPNWRARTFLEKKLTLYSHNAVMTPWLKADDLEKWQDDSKFLKQWKGNLELPRLPQREDIFSWWWAPWEGCLPRVEVWTLSTMNSSRCKQLQSLLLLSLLLKSCLTYPLIITWQFDVQINLDLTDTELTDYIQTSRRNTGLAGNVR